MGTLHLKKSISRSPSRLALLLFPLVVAGSVLLWGAGAEAIAATYTTNFPLIENPISEGGHWINGLINGIDWADVATTPGRAFGTQTGLGPNYADSTALLTGSWGPTQTVEAVVYVAATNTTTFQEVELRLRSAISAHSCTGYEILFSVNPIDPYCQIVRWNGPLGDFTGIGGSNVGVVDGDVVKATIVGNTITAYINGAVICSATDSTYSSGNPGMGFYLQFFTLPLADALNYGFSSYSASDGTQSPTPTPTGTATIPPSPTPTATPTPTPTVTPTPTPTPTGITLAARGHRVHRIHVIDLSWTGANSANVDIFRNGALIATVPNTGVYTDSTGNRARHASYAYEVCEASTANCSNEVTITF
jgi:hypothetical protein